MRDLTGPDRHPSPLDPPRIRTGPPWPEPADPSRPCPIVTHQPPSPSPIRGSQPHPCETYGSVLSAILTPRIRSRSVRRDFAGAGLDRSHAA
jgi:hypothetical protein